MRSGRASWVAWVSVGLGVVVAACSSDDAGGSGGSGGGGSIAGTSTSTGTGPACEPSLASIQATVFQASCACGNVCAPGQDCVEGACTCASSSVSFAADVQPILTASCATIGCHRLGVDLCFGTRMPKTSPLPGSDAAVIADWICGGALDD